MDLRRWLKSLNISVASEVRQRSLATDIVGDNLVAELGAFSFRGNGGGEEIKEVPFAYVPNLIRKASDLVEQHRGYKSEVCLINLIPHYNYSLEHQQGSHGMRSYPSRNFG